LKPPSAGRLRRAKILHLSYSIASIKHDYLLIGLLSTFVAHGAALLQ
jgi:hypothetical protein